MNIALLVLEIVLLIWFFGCIVTFRISRHILVEGMGIHSAEFIMFCLYASGILGSIIFPLVGRRILIFILLAWFIIQFFCHWYYTIFGASEAKIKGYNQCFRNTVKIIPLNEHRIIPDLYHIVLHGLILLNGLLSALSLYSAK